MLNTLFIRNSDKIWTGLVISSTTHLTEEAFSLPQQKKAIDDGMASIKRLKELIRD